MPFYTTSLYGVDFRDNDVGYSFVALAGTVCPPDDTSYMTQDRGRMEAHT